METKLSQEHMKYKQQELDYKQGLSVSSHGQNGGLALLWKPDSKEQFKDSRVGTSILISHALLLVIWRLTSFYGQPNTSKCEETWFILESLSHSNHLPWLCIGDYNEIISQIETSRCRTRLTRQLEWFCHVINCCGSHNLGFVGSPFTWSRNNRT